MASGQTHLKGSSPVGRVIGRSRIARKLVNKDTDPVLALQENHDMLYHEVKHLYTDGGVICFVDSSQAVAGRPRRVEIRHYWTIGDGWGMGQIVSSCCGTWSSIH
jgi:hypothetical protein